MTTRSKKKYSGKKAPETSYSCIPPTTGKTISSPWWYLRKPNTSNPSIFTRANVPRSPRSPYEIDNPVTVNDQIIYRGAFDANNSFYRQTQPQKFGANILNSKFGLRYPIVSPNKDSLLFSFYTSDGYKPGKIAINQLENKVIDTQTFRIADSVTQQENWQFEVNRRLHLRQSEIQQKPPTYSTSIAGAPIFPDAEDVDIDFGLAVSSQNKLSTLFLTAGFVRGKGYEHGNWQVKATYKGFWPTCNWNSRADAMTISCKITR